jgi:class 3 adenylate cyclase/tetratricopeptide (TPR) repeat protein
MSTCPACGAQAVAASRFCAECGVSLAPAPVRREERRIVSVLFADLVGFTSRSEAIDVEDVGDVLGPYYARVRAELQRFGGTVEKFIGDAVMAVFGAPVAHEDDPERAVRAALAVRDAIASMNEKEPGLDLHVRIAVTTGEALVNLAARPELGEAMAAGDVVNTCARLQSAAPVDGVLAGEVTHRATARVFDYRPAASVLAKGKAEPVPAWEVLRPVASLGLDVDQAPSTPLIAREREVALLRHALDRVASLATPQLVTLVGVPGIGKSRLLHELRALVDAEPDMITWRQGRSVPYGDGGPLWALAEMVKAQTGVLDSDASDVVEKKLAEALGLLPLTEDERGFVLRHLRTLVGLSDAQSSGAARDESFAAWRRFLEALAQAGPLVLVFEDLHWADDALLDFVDELLEWTSEVQLLAVATARPELLTRRPGWGGGKANVSTMSLEPLTEHDTARLVTARLGGVNLPGPVMETLLSRAGGNPLFAEEYAAMIADVGDVPADALPMPDTVQGVIAARLDTLAPEEKSLLQDAAVLGKVVWTGAVAQVGGVDTAVAERRIHQLVRREFLKREHRSAVSGEAQYAFRHALVRDVAYGQIPRRERVEKHLRIAEWIEQLSPDRAEDRAEMLASHYLTAIDTAALTSSVPPGLLDRTLRALQEAGERAAALNSYAAAIDWYETALRWAPPDGNQRAYLKLRLGQACSLSQPWGGTEELREAASMLLAAGDREYAGEALASLGRALPGISEPIAVLRQALELLDGMGESAIRARAMVDLALSYTDSPVHTELALGLSRSAETVAVRIGREDLRGYALAAAGVARFLAGDVGGLDDLSTAQEIGVRLNSSSAVSMSLNLANVLADFGDLARAGELNLAAHAMAERFGRAAVIREDDAPLWNLYFAGRLSEALVEADQLVDRIQPGSQRITSALLARSLVRLRQHDPEGALSDLGRVDSATTSDDTATRSWSLAIAAHAHLVHGNEAEASEALRALANLAEHASTWCLRWGPCLPHAAVVAVQTGQQDLVLGMVDHLVRRSARTPWFDAVESMASGRYEEAARRYDAIGTVPEADEARRFAATSATQR